MARTLAPSLVVIEDVDLIANERHQVGHETNPLLFALLNEMDGIDGDADVAFLLTTDRADILEPALAQRPGRIDLAVEIPLPNAACRRRLLRQYGKPLDLKFTDSADLVARPKGVPASFIKELLHCGPAERCGYDNVTGLFTAPKGAFLTAQSGRSM